MYFIHNIFQIMNLHMYSMKQFHFKHNFRVPFFLPNHIPQQILAMYQMPLWVFFTILHSSSYCFKPVTCLYVSFISNFLMSSLFGWYLCVQKCYATGGHIPKSLLSLRLLIIICLYYFKMWKKTFYRSLMYIRWNYFSYFNF